MVRESAPSRIMASLDQKANMSAIRAVWKTFAIVAALSFLYASVLSKLGHDWWTDENYSHGLLIPFIIGYILWLERPRLASISQRPRLLWGGAFILCALAGLWAGTVGAELFVQRLSLILMLAGIVVYFWGFKLLRFALVPLLLLLLAIPIPAIIFNQIAFPLQLFASRCAVWVMRAFDISVLRQGNIIELMPLGASQPKKLEVVEACSGIRSLMTLVTLAVVFAYFTYPRRDDHDDSGDGGPTEHQEPRGLFAFVKSYGFWRSVTLVLSAIPIAIATNALRVSGTGVLANYYGSKVADGFFHYFSGWVVYVIAFLLLLVVGWLLERAGRFWGHHKSEAQGASDVKQEKKAVQAEASVRPREKGAAPVKAIPVKGTD
jgi:eight transmembrane protein EpsH (proposed exosortase)